MYRGFMDGMISSMPRCALAWPSMILKCAVGGTCSMSSKQRVLAHVARYADGHCCG
jgi:hypothetical protein